MRCRLQPILNPSLKGRTLYPLKQSPFPLGEGRGEAYFRYPCATFAQGLWGPRLLVLLAPLVPL